MRQDFKIRSSAELERPGNFVGVDPNCAHVATTPKTQFRIVVPATRRHKGDVAENRNSNSVPFLLPFENAIPKCQPRCINPPTEINDCSVLS